MRAIGIILSTILVIGGLIFGTMGLIELGAELMRSHSTPLVVCGGMLYLLAAGIWVYIFGLIIKPSDKQKII